MCFFMSAADRRCRRLEFISAVKTIELKIEVFMLVSECVCAVLASLKVGAGSETAPAALLFRVYCFMWVQKSTLRRR